MKASGSAGIQEKICRLCLSDAGVILPIFDGEVAERFSVPLPMKIRACVSIDVSVSDPLPSLICHRCLYEVDRFHEFKEICEKANTTLQQCFNRHDNIMDLTKLMEIKQEVFDETVYHDAVDDPLDEEEDEVDDNNDSYGDDNIGEGEENCVDNDQGSLPCHDSRDCDDGDTSVDVKDQIPEGENNFNDENGDQNIEDVSSITDMPSNEIPGEEKQDTTGVDITNLTQQISPRHKNAEVRRARYSCRFCSKPFVYLTSLQKHEAAPHTGRNCKFCLKPFSDMAKLKKHEKIYCRLKSHVTNIEKTKKDGSQPKATNETEVFSCKFCSRQFKIRGHWWCHERMYCDANPNRLTGRSKTSVLTERMYICRYCSKSFIHRGSWWRHEKYYCNVNPSCNERKVSTELGPVSKEGKTDLYSCHYCSKCFIHRGSWWRHEKTHSGTKPFACKYCPKAFGGKPHLLRHERVHLGIKPFCCGICGKAFSDSSNLRNHEKIHDGYKSFLCSVCGKSYCNKALLLKHELVHTGIRAHICEICSKTFVDASDLKKHVKCHNEVRPYLCSECGKSFTQSWQLKSHINIHAGLKPYTCQICQKAFSDSSNFRSHQKLHICGPRPYPCPQCPLSFYQNSQLKYHMRVHTGEKPFKCRFCPKSFRIRAKLRTHEESHALEAEPELSASVPQMQQEEVIVEVIAEEVIVSTPNVQLQEEQK